MIILKFIIILRKVYKCFINLSITCLLFLDSVLPLYLNLFDTFVLRSLAFLVKISLSQSYFFTMRILQLIYYIWVHNILGILFLNAVTTHQLLSVVLDVELSIQKCFLVSANSLSLTFEKFSMSKICKTFIQNYFT